MVLSKDGIMYCCQHMHLIDNYRLENIQTCSYDLRMGEQYYFYKEGDHKVNVCSLRQNESLKIPPNAICYVITEESVNMPQDLTASISLAFGLIKKGVMLAAQPPYDPGYHGKTVALLHNLSNEPVKIKRGDHILNIIFTKLSMPVDSNQLYNGSYQNLRDLKDYCDEVRIGAVFELNAELRKIRTRFYNSIPTILTIITVLIGLITLIVTVPPVASSLGFGGKTEAPSNTVDTNNAHPEFFVDKDSNILTVRIDGQDYEIDIRDRP